MKEKKHGRKEVDRGIAFADSLDLFSAANDARSMLLLDLGHAHHSLGGGVHVGAGAGPGPRHVVPDLDPDHLLHHRQELGAERRWGRGWRQTGLLLRRRRVQLERRRHLRRSRGMLLYMCWRRCR